MRFTAHFCIGLLWSSLILTCIPGFSQSDSLLTEPLKEKPKSGSYEKHSLHIAYRVPEFRTLAFTIPGYPRFYPQPFPIVLGYSYFIGQRHALTAEAGWSIREAVRLYSDLGVPTDYFRAVRPELRLSYRWMLSKSRGFVPYLGLATTFSGDYSSTSPSDRWFQYDFRLQALAGARIYPLDGPIFIQLEIPFSIYRTITIKDNILPTFKEFWPKPFTSQFWPVAGIGFRW